MDPENGHAPHPSFAVCTYFGEGQGFIYEIQNIGCQYLNVGK